MPPTPRQKTAIYKTNCTVKKTRWRTRIDHDHGQGHHLPPDTANSQVSVLTFLLTHTTHTRTRNSQTAFETHGAP